MQTAFLWAAFGYLMATGLRAFTHEIFALEGFTEAVTTGLIAIPVLLIVIATIMLFYDNH